MTLSVQETLPSVEGQPSNKKTKTVLPVRRKNLLITPVKLN